MQKIIILLILIVNFSLLSCTNIDNFNEAIDSNKSSYYMPNIDIFIIRNAGISRFNDGYNMDVSIADFVLESFVENNEDSINEYLSQLNTVFYNAKVRIFYISVPVENIQLQFLTYSNSFQLTNEAGDENKGTVYNENGPLKIFLAQYPTDSGSYSGLGWLGAKGVLILSRGGVSNKTLSIIGAHELGHNFGLHHPFDDDGNANSASCDGQQKGSTNRIMDYVSNPEVFAPCEIIIATNWIDNRYQTKKQYKPYQPDVEKYIGDWQGQVTIGEASSPIITDAMIMEFIKK